MNEHLYGLGIGIGVMLSGVASAAIAAYFLWAWILMDDDERCRKAVVTFVGLEACVNNPLCQLNTLDQIRFIKARKTGTIYCARTDIAGLLLVPTGGNTDKEVPVPDEEDLSASN